MSLLFETIKLKDGVFYNLEYHEKRMMSSFYRLYGLNVGFSLKNYLYNLNFPQLGLYKVKVIYDKIVTKVEISEYKKRKVEKLLVVFNDTISYDLKYIDRRCFDMCSTESFAEPLFIKNGMVSDTTFSNVAFLDGEKWITPSTFLLNGTKRQYYIDKDVLKVTDVRFADITKYKKVSLINAMLDLEDIVLDVKSIHF